MNSLVVKETCDIFIEYFTYLINLNFNTGKFRDPFKLSKVIPIFQTGDYTEVDNYRPLSISYRFSVKL